MKVGLDFCVEGAKTPREERPHWSYSGFGSFRKCLAKEVGIELDKMEGFCEFDWLEEMRAGTLEQARANEGPKRSWDEIDDPLKFLLYHSDCDGELTPEECALIAPRMRELMESWPTCCGIESYNRDHGERLADLMDKSVELNQPLIFT